MGISFNAAGLLNGNGIDVASIVKEMLAPDAASITQLQNQQTDLSTQAGLLQGYANNLSNLQSAIVALANPTGPLASQAATSSDSGVLTASAQNTAAASTHQIVVSSLATTGAIYTNPLANGTTSFLAQGQATGDIKLQVGGPGGATRDIAITQGSNDTLNTLASYINQQNWGVIANVVTDANGARLALFSQATGTPGALSITSNTTALTFNPPVGGANASLTIDGVPYSSATNTVTGAIPGVTLNLASAAPGETVLLTVGPDTNAATTAINTFVSAYNTVINNLNSQFAVDPTTNAQGPLGADSALRALQSSLLNDVTYSISGNNGLVNLAAIGVDMNNDGTLSVNQVATDTHPSLASVLASNPSGVQSFFQNSAGNGFAQAFNNDLVNLTDATNGILNVDINGNQTQQKELTTRVNNLQDRLSAEQAALTLELDQVNATLEAYPSLLSEVTAVIGALNGNANATPAINTDTTPLTGTPVNSSSGS